MTEAEYVELIDKYLVTRDESGTPSYRWTDNTGEIVRCKDCVMYRRDKELAEASYLDPNYHCGLLQSEMPEDGFCSYGKRRGGDAE